MYISDILIFIAAKIKQFKNVYFRYFNFTAEKIKQFINVYFRYFNFTAKKKIIIK